MKRTAAALAGIRLVLILAGLLVTAAAWAEENELREFRLGMPVADLPASGYTSFACEDGAALAGWEDYRRCPADAAGLRAVRFRYDAGDDFRGSVNDTYAGTKVAGHPVLLTLLIGEGTLEGLQIETDPEARLFMRKKAHLLGDTAKARYGEDNWACTEGQPGPGEEPVGGVFVKEHCEKTTPTRRYVLDRSLFRRPGEELKQFISSTRLQILRLPTHAAG